jgi:hypothetical protein
MTEEEYAAYHDLIEYLREQLEQEASDEGEASNEQ